MEVAVASPEIDLSQFRGHPIELETFQGPLDLLLHLIKKDRIEIWEISVSRITRQYLEYLSTLQSLNIEIAGDFLVMAATLMRMKSQMLLPRPSFLAEEDEDGVPLTREALIARLLEYRKFREAARSLRQMEATQGRRFPRGAPASLDAGIVLPLREPRLFDLVEYFQDILARGGDRPGHEVRLEEIRIEDRIERILAALSEGTEREPLPAGLNPPGEGGSGVRFSRLLTPGGKAMEVVVTFLAVLELTKLQRLSPQQIELFSEIWLLDPVRLPPEPEVVEEGEDMEVIRS